MLLRYEMHRVRDRECRKCCKVREISAVISAVYFPDEWDISVRVNEGRRRGGSEKRRSRLTSKWQQQSSR